MRRLLALSLFAVCALLAGCGSDTVKADAVDGFQNAGLPPGEKAITARDQ